jgi:hypothetical protein
MVSRALVRLINGSTACGSRINAPRIPGSFCRVDKGVSFLFLIPIL